ncbi:MAG: electron transporter RnfC, partial [Marinilabiliales bacterium]
MLKTFALGGVHPAENKLSANAAIEVLDPPKQAFIPLGQNLGAPSKVVVKKAEEVKVGQLLAEASGFISTPIHSPVSGKIFKIDNILNASGYKQQGIIINVEGDEWMEDIDRSEDLVTNTDYSKDEIIDKIKKAGLVGMGG